MGHKTLNKRSKMRYWLGITWQNIKGFVLVAKCLAAVAFDRGAIDRQTGGRWYLFMH